MVENTLFEKLETYNKQQENHYKDNWGSLLSFINAEDTDMLTKKAEFMRKMKEPKHSYPINSGMISMASRQ